MPPRTDTGGGAAGCTNSQHADLEQLVTFARRMWHQISSCGVFEDLQQCKKQANDYLARHLSSPDQQAVCALLDTELPELLFQSFSHCLHVLAADVPAAAAGSASQGTAASADAHTAIQQASSMHVTTLLAAHVEYLIIYIAGLPNAAEVVPAMESSGLLQGIAAACPAIAAMWRSARDAYTSAMEQQSQQQQQRRRQQRQRTQQRNQYMISQLEAAVVRAQLAAAQVGLATHQRNMVRSLAVQLLTVWRLTTEVFAELNRTAEVPAEELPPVPRQHEQWSVTPLPVAQLAAALSEACPVQRTLAGTAASARGGSSGSSSRSQAPRPAANFAGNSSSSSVGDAARQSHITRSTATSTRSSSSSSSSNNNQAKTACELSRPHALDDPEQVKALQQTVMYLISALHDGLTSAVQGYKQRALLHLAAAPAAGVRDLVWLLFVNLAWSVGAEQQQQQQQQQERRSATAAAPSGSANSSSSSSVRQRGGLAPPWQDYVMHTYHAAFLDAVGAPATAGVAVEDLCAWDVVDVLAELASTPGNLAHTTPAHDTSSGRSTISSSSSNSTGYFVSTAGHHHHQQQHQGGQHLLHQQLADALPFPETLLLLSELLLLDPGSNLATCQSLMHGLFELLWYAGRAAAVRGAASVLLLPLLTQLPTAVLAAAAAAAAGCSGMRAQLGASSEEAAVVVWMHSNFGMLVVDTAIYASAPPSAVAAPSDKSPSPEALLPTLRQQPAAACRALDMAVRGLTPANGVVPRHPDVLVNFCCCALWSVSAVAADASLRQGVGQLQAADCFSLGISCLKLAAAGPAAAAAAAAASSEAPDADGVAAAEAGPAAHRSAWAGDRCHAAAVLAGTGRLAGAMQQLCTVHSTTPSSSSRSSRQVLLLLLWARIMRMAGQGYMAAGTAAAAQARDQDAAAAAAAGGSDVQGMTGASWWTLITACEAGLQAVHELLPCIQLPGAPGSEEACSTAHQQLQQQCAELQQQMSRSRDALGPAAVIALVGGVVTPLYLRSTSDALGAQQMQSAAALAVRVGFGQQLVQFGEALCGQLPVPLCCKYPGCVELLGASEQLLVAGKGSVCSRCRSARYCCRACQVAHLRQHKTVCKRIAGQQAAG